MRRSNPLIVPLVLLSAACLDRPGPTDPAPRLQAMLRAEEVGQLETPEQMDVAHAVPGFGGYFIDPTGAPTVWLTGPSRRPEAETALAGFLESFGWTAADLQVRQADYEYLHLDAWYRQVWPEVLAIAGAVSSDVDEGTGPSSWPVSSGAAAPTWPPVRCRSSSAPQASVEPELGDLTTEDPLPTTQKGKGPKQKAK